MIPFNELNGIYHVSSNPISKHDLLVLMKDHFKKDLAILPDRSYACDRSLDSSGFKQLTGYLPPTWSSMIGELKNETDLYSTMKNEKA